MKAIMISIQPQWIEKILKGEKTIEIRKTMPKCELPIKVYIYCTKNNTSLLYKTCKSILNEKEEYELYSKSMGIETYLNGKVVAEFTLNKINFIKMPANITKDFMGKACLTGEELMRYLGGMVFKSFYAWHIDDLKIYDTLKELSEFKYPNKPIYYEDNKKAIYGYSVGCKLTRPPQSWCYVEELEEV